MRSLEAIEKEISQLGFEASFIVRKEVKELPNILRDDEVIYGLAQGFYTSNTWLVICTSTRMLFLDKGMIFGLKQLEIPLERISSIGVSTGLLMGSITICDSFGKSKIDNIAKKEVKRFAESINIALENIKKSNASSHSKDNVQALSAAQELEKLAELKSKGFITDDEFAQQKKKILAA